MRSTTKIFGEREKTAYSAATHLIVYGLVVALPLILALGALLLHSIQVQEEQVKGRVVQVLRDLTNEVDQDIDRHITVLRTLETSPLLQKEDWPAFYEQARASLHAPSYLILIDAAGRQLVNTHAPYGAQPEFTGDRETLLRIVQSKQPVVSNLFLSLAVKKPVFNISIPILRDGKVSHVMSLGLLPENLKSILNGLYLSPEWVTTIWDGRGIILARSRDDENLLGTAMPARLLSTGDQGRVFKTIDLNGEDVLHAAARSKLSDWGFAVDVPVWIVRRQMWLGLALWGGISLLASLLAVYLGLVFGRWLSRPISATAAAATALGRGDKFYISHSRLKEVNRLGEALIEAEHKVRNRSKDLQESERRLAAILETLPVAIGLVDKAGRAVVANRPYSTFVPELLPSRDGARHVLWEGYETDGRRIEPENFPASRALRGERVWPGQEFLYHGDSERGPFWTRVGALPFRDEDDKIAGATLVIIDIDHERRTQDHKNLLIRELNHRVKNTLTIVQSLASQTFKDESDRNATRAFEARLIALSSAHDVLTRESWESAGLQEIIEQAIAPYCSEQNCFELAGPAVRLHPKFALTVAMTIHELCTNAAKYGSLSSPEGRVSIIWSVEDGTYSAQLNLRWQERGGPPVQKPKRKGFGSVLIEKLLAYDLDAEVVISYARDGVSCVIQAPLREGKPRRSPVHGTSLRRERRNEQVLR